MARRTNDIDRSTMQATWIAGVAAVISVLLSLVSLGFSIWTFQKISTETLVLSVSRYPGDFPTQIQPIAMIVDSDKPPVKTGTLDLYWEILVSNTGERTISLISYDLIQLSETGIISYSRMDQGLFVVSEEGEPSDKIAPISLPIAIQPGESTKIYLKCGIVMGQNAYKLANERYGNKSIYSLRELIENLYSDGIDFYDNPAISDYPGVVTVGSEGRKEQVFLVKFKTSRNTYAEDMVSWYQYSGDLPK